MPQANILAIESSAAHCSVALFIGDTIYQREAAGQRSHTDFLLSFIDELIHEAAISSSDLQAVAFSAGPGSFTGIRLASSVAKSFAYALQIPLLAVSSLEVAAYLYCKAHPEQPVMVISDARMGDIYCGEYQWQGTCTQALLDDSMRPLSSLSRDDIRHPVVLSDCPQLLGDLQQQLDFDLQALELTAVSVASIGRQHLSRGLGKSALQAEAIYLRDKTAWNNIEQQKLLKQS